MRLFARRPMASLVLIVGTAVLLGGAVALADVCSDGSGSLVIGGGGANSSVGRQNRLSSSNVDACPENVSKIVRTGQVFEQAGDLSKAEALYKAAASSAESTTMEKVVALDKLAEVYEKEGHYKEARATYASALKLLRTGSNRSASQEFVDRSASKIEAGDSKLGKYFADRMEEILLTMQKKEERTRVYGPSDPEPPHSSNIEMQPPGDPKPRTW